MVASDALEPPGRRWPMLLAAGLALVLLGAHFLRAQAWLPMALCLLALALLTVPRRWALRAVQVALVAGSAEWVWTTLVLVQQRGALGRPWLRMALILGAVALLTAGAAWLLQRGLRRA